MGNVENVKSGEGGTDSVWNPEVAGLRQESADAVRHAGKCGVWSGLRQSGGVPVSGAVHPLSTSGRSCAIRNGERPTRRRGAFLKGRQSPVRAARRGRPAWNAVWENRAFFGRHGQTAGEVVLNMPSMFAVQRRRAQKRLCSRRGSDAPGVCPQPSTLSGRRIRPNRSPRSASQIGFLFSRLARNRSRTSIFFQNLYIVQFFQNKDRPVNEVSPWEINMPRTGYQPVLRGKMKWS